MWDQIAIGCTAVIAVWLSQHRKRSFQRWASVFGLIGQPFWFYATYKAHQWGIFTMCFLYTYCWFQGFYNYWIRKGETK